MKTFLLAAFLSCSWTAATQAQTTKAPPNAIVVDETKTVEVAPKSKAAPAKAGAANTSKKVTTGKNSFTTTTTTTKVVPAPTPVASATPNYGGYSAPAISQPSPTQNALAAPSAAPMASTTTAATPAPAAEPKSPWKASYFGEYFGPRLSNIDLSQTQGPDDANSSYGFIDHYLKILYGVSKSNNIGVSVRARTPFDPAKTFSFKNFRLVGSWNNMVDTPDLNMSTVLEVEFPTTDAARQAGNIINFNIKLNWELKTQARNWSFTAMTLIRPMFYESVAKNPTDLYFGIFPWITYDFAPNWQFLIDASFDASHSYQSTFFDYTSDDPDFVGLGVIYSFSPHVQLNPEFRFFTGNLSFKAAILYTGLTIAL